MINVTDKRRSNATITSDEQYGSRARCCVPMISRLDRLDSMKRYIEGRQSSSRCGSSSSGSSNWNEGTEKLQSMRMMMPLDTAIKEIHIKGSLLDRLASLENRLFQLCLEVEGLSSSSSSSMAHKYENAPLSQAVPSSSTTEIGSSSSTMSLDDQALAAFDAHQYCSFHQALAERFNFLGNTMDNNSTTQVRHLLEESRGEGEESSNSEKNKKKLKARSSSKRWRRLLGC